ncbi:MAG: orotidine-5'-phosphate decarboxylase, partial [Bdellovibrionales bacterium]|nr:orotidine-5'-phosphate decarboxylase [Bdellovibrionales bacterium]
SLVNKVIIALDLSSDQSARKVVNQLGSEIQFYKVGLQLLTAAGPSFIRELILAGKKVFLDLKLFEVPNSVKNAVVAAGDLGVSMITVHASGGMNIMEAAVRAAESYPGLKVLALTVVTSLTNQDLVDVGIQNSCEDQVLRLAKLASESGCHGLIASPAELIPLRKFTSDMTIVTPGIRISGENPSDNLRSDTPASAIRNGASYIIVGRSVVGSHNPKAAIKKIWEIN